MNNKILIVLGVVAVLGCALVGWGLHAAVTGSPMFGATTSTYNSALNQVSLYNWQVDAVNSLNAVRTPLSGIVTGSAVVTGLPAISSSSLLGTSTVVTGMAGALGDILSISPTTSTPGIVWVANIETASTSNATVRIAAVYASSTANPGTQSVPSPITFNLTVLPRATFAAPAALSVTTTSAPLGL